jgi:hypothetical protein
MAAGSLLAQFTAGDLYRETSLGYNPWATSSQYVTNQGSSRGVILNKFVIPGQLTEYYNGIWILPSLVALATGLTFKIIITDSGLDPADLGKAVRLEVTPFNFSAALAVVDWSLPASKGTTTAVNQTLGATTGLPVVATVPIVSANLAGLAAGGILGMRIRRVGDNAGDTCNGQVIMLGGQIADT